MEGNNIYGTEEFLKLMLSSVLFFNWFPVKYLSILIFIYVIFVILEDIFRSLLWFF
jgi:hypothetical protein